jgi:hypothetical protein
LVLLAALVLFRLSLEDMGFFVVTVRETTFFLAIQALSPRLRDALIWL